MTRRLRFRIAAVSVLLVTGALVLAATVTLSLQRGQLLDEIDRSLDESVVEVGSGLIRGPLHHFDPDHLAEDLAFAASTQVVPLSLQLLDADGTVLVAAGSWTTDIAIVATAEVGDRFTTAESGGSGERLRVASVRLVEDERSPIIVVGRSLVDVDRATSTLRSIFLVGVPVLAVALGVLIWMMVGRALGPVDRIRRDVEAIGATDLHRRVSVPATPTELAELATTMNAMLERLDRAVDEQRRFVSDASHELRSPIAGLRSRLEVVLEHPRDVVWSDDAAELLAETLRMEQLVDDLLVLAGSDAGPVGGDRGEVDMEDVVVEESHRVARQANVPIDVHAEGDQLTVPGRVADLRRLVDNLLENAVRHANTRVNSSVYRQNGTIVVQVTDDGPGVPADHAEAIFERFTRLDQARSRHEGGAGLGLAIARTITRDHGGTVDLDPSHDGGARFIVRLPATTTAASTTT